MSSERGKGKQRKNIRKMMGLRTGEEAEGRFFPGRSIDSREGQEGTPHQALDVQVTDVRLPHPQHLPGVSVFSVNDRAGPGDFQASSGS